MFVHFPKKLGVISLLSEISCVDPNSRAEQAWSHSVINLRSAHLHVMFLGYQKFCIAVIRTIGWAIASFISRRSQNICEDLLELLGSCSNILRVQLSSIIREQFSGERCALGDASAGPDVNDRGCCGWGRGRRSGQGRSSSVGAKFGPEPDSGPGPRWRIT